MNIFADFERRIVGILEAIVASGRLPAHLDLTRFTVEPPRDPAHGDLACNAAMVYAADAKPHFADPRQLATEIAAGLAEDPDVERSEVAGPGFLNIRLRSHVYTTVLVDVLRQGGDFGRGPSIGHAANIEYVSANPTGPMHVGHGRGAVFGDALARLLAFAGATVTREYYINDAGAQVDVLGRSAFLRYREALGETIGQIPEGLYPGEYLKEVGARLAAQHGRDLLGAAEEVWLPIARDAAIDAMMAAIQDDLAALNIHHDVFFSERSLQAMHGNGDAVTAAIENLRDKGLVFEGRLPPPKGQHDADWEDRVQLLFRSTAFGDDVDRPLIKSNGAYTYFASDIAYHKNKLDRGFRTLIDVLGADHGGYRKRMQAAVAALSDGRAVLDVKLCQLVNLMRNGVAVKMSKRSGDFVTLREVIDEVGADAVRFMMLFRKNDAPLDFDLAKVIEQSKENPAFYVQYAHARGFSVLRLAAQTFPGIDLGPQSLAVGSLDHLDDVGERALMRSLAQFPRLIEAASTAHEPHRIAFYLYDLASLFHAQWNRGSDDKRLRFVQEDRRDLTLARLALVSAVIGVVANGLAVLGVGAPNEMR